MPGTFAEWEARRKAGGSSAMPVEAPDAGLVDTPLGNMHEATQGDDWTSAAEAELLRTAKEAGIGLARSPLDLVTGLAHTVAHPLDTLMGLGHQIAHPIETVTNFAKNPREAGSALGQLLLAPKVPGAAETALAEGPGVVGRGMGAVGRGLETAGKSKLARRGGAAGAAYELFTGHPGTAAATAVIPPALEYGGRTMQRGGAALEGLDLAAQARKLGSTFGTAEAAPIDPEADTVRETVKTAREVKANGASTAQASARAGWPLGKSEEIPYQAETATPNPDLFPYQKESLDGLRSAARVDTLGKKVGLNSFVGERPSLDVNEWANDASAKPETPLSPIEEFYKNDPQARVGGEGRMTGQFEEGNGGLSDATAGNLDLHISPTLLDQLSQLSGRALPPEEAQALFNKFRNFRVQE